MVRFKNRYFVLEINPENRMDKDKDKKLILQTEAIKQSLIDAIQRLHGDHGVAAITFGLVAKYCNVSTRIAIIRARHGPHRIVGSSLPFINRIGDIGVSIHTLYTGATMRHCFKFVQRHQRQQLTRMDVKLKHDKLPSAKDEINTLQKDYMDMNVLNKLKI